MGFAPPLRRFVSLPYERPPACDASKCIAAAGNCIVSLLSLSPFSRSALADVLQQLSQECLLVLSGDVRSATPRSSWPPAGGLWPVGRPQSPTVCDHGLSAVSERRDSTLTSTVTRRRPHSHGRRTPVSPSTSSGLYKLWHVTDVGLLGPRKGERK